MTETSHPDPAIVRETLRAAIADTYEQESDLFAHRTHERSLIFHIGRRLAADITAWDTELSVDVEYNRWNSGRRKEAETKYLHGFNLDGTRRNVFPDLIIHNRSGSTADHNILVLEVKWSPSQRDREFDHKKLRAYRDLFLYQQAVFVEFPARGEPPLWEWITANDLGPGRLPILTAWR